MIYLFSIIIYFFLLRLMIKSGYEINELSAIFVILIVGFIPFLNIALIVLLAGEFLAYLEDESLLDYEDLLKKILFIKEK